MLRIDRTKRTLKKLDQQSLPDAELRERSDLQQMIRNSSADFFAEMGEKLLLIGEEVRPTDVVDDRIDLLAIDQEGAAVIIEIKRGSHKFHLLQALSYAAMVSKWPGDRILSEYRSLVSKTADEGTNDIEQFINADIETLNDSQRSQRVFLLAENFDYEVLVTAEWLSERYDVDVRCYRLGLSSDGAAAFLTCTCIYPPPELAEHAIRRKRELGKPSRWQNWDEALAALGNEVVAAFFRKEVASGRENSLLKRRLIYRVNRKRAWAVTARKERAYVWQEGRFKDDEKYWVKKIGTDAEVEPIKGGGALRFYLTSGCHFENFLDAVQRDLSAVEFLNSDDTADLETEE